MKSEADFVNQATRSSTGAWFETHARIWPKDRTKGLIKPKQNHLQRLAQRVVDKFEDLELPIRIMGLKPRQKGSTTIFCAHDYCFLRRHAASGIIIGGQYAQVKEAWDMLTTYQANDSFDWKNSGGINTKEGKWSNGSKLISETAGDVVAGIGGTHQVLHAFEVARWGRGGTDATAEVLANIVKCVPLVPATMVILESTAEGMTGDFYDRYIVAVDAEKFLSGEIVLQPGQYVRLFAAWFQFEDSAFRLTEEEKEEIRATLDAEAEYDGERELIELYGHYDDAGVLHLGKEVTNFDVYEQLAWRRYAIREECKKEVDNFNRDYPHSWQTAFQKSGKGRFNAKGVNVMTKRAQDHAPKTMHGMIEESKGRFAFRQADRNESTVTIFEKPMKGQRYILPIDVMTGATQTGGKDPDYHSAIVLRAGFWDANGRWRRPCTAARIVQCRWDIDVFEKGVWNLGRYYGPAGNTCKIAIEMNMDRGLTELLKLRAGVDLYQRELFNRRDMKFTQALGFQTNEKTRENLIEALAKAIREYEKPGEGIDIFCPIAARQCETFVVKESGRSEAGEGSKDDDVLSISLGLTLMEHATTYWPPPASFGLPPDLRGAGGREQGGFNQYS